MHAVHTVDRVRITKRQAGVTSKDRFDFRLNGGATRPGKQEPQQLLQVRDGREMEEFFWMMV